MYEIYNRIEKSFMDKNSTPKLELYVQ
jgi:hypothetical protein